MKRFFSAKEVSLPVSTRQRAPSIPALHPGVKVLLKAGLSLAVLGYLFRRVEVEQLRDTLLEARLSLFLLALSLEILNHALSAFRWKVVANALGQRFPLNTLVRYYFIGMFFNLFLPSPLGGDIARGVCLAKDGNNGSAVAASVFLDRFAGMISLLMISLAASFLFFTRFTGIASGPLDLLLLLTILGALLVGLSFSFWPVLPGKIGSLSEAFVEKFSLFWRQPRAVGVALGISLLCQSAAVAAHILLGLAVGLDVPVAYYFVFVPLSNALGALPVSLNGLGIREGGYVYFLGLTQTPAGRAFGFSVLWFLILVCSGLIGGVIYLLGERGAKTTLRAASP